jgi:hypothetical protein
MWKASRVQRPAEPDSVPEHLGWEPAAVVLAAGLVIGLLCELPSQLDMSQQLSTLFHGSRDGKFEAHRRVKSWLLAGVETGRDERYAVMLMMSSAVNLSTTILISVTLEFEPLRTPCWMSKICRAR